MILPWNFVVLCSSQNSATNESRKILDQNKHSIEWNCFSAIIIKYILNASPFMWWFKVYIWVSESLFIGRLIWLMYKIMLHMLISFIASCPYGMDYTSTEGTDATKSMTGQLHGSRSLRSAKVTRFGVQILNFLENNIRWLVSMEGSLF